MTELRTKPHSMCAQKTCFVSAEKFFFLYSLPTTPWTLSDVMGG